MRYGHAKGVPSWAQALVLAERGWGHPDDIMKRPGGIVWAARQAALDEARQRSAKMDRQKNKR